MADVQDIIDSVMAQLRPDSQIHVEVSIPQMLTFINDAALDVRNSGWMINIADDESITFAQNDYHYNVPSAFTYVHELRIENTTLNPSTYDEAVDLHFWRIEEDVANTPQFTFHTAFPLPNGKKLKIMGQQRPSLYTSITDTIDAGMESFMREASLASALSYMASARPEIEFERSRFVLSQEARARAERFLAVQPMRFRQKPNGRYVPSR